MKRHAISLPPAAGADDGTRALRHGRKPAHPAGRSRQTRAGIGSQQISPDGRSVVVVVARPNYDENRTDSELVLVDIASLARRPLTVDRRSVAHPRWSPTGDRLAFLALSGTGRYAALQIFVMPMAGGDARRLSSSPTGVQQFAWSPDGRTVAFATADEPEQRKGADRSNQSFEVTNDNFLTTAAPTSTHIWLMAPCSPLRRLAPSPHERRVEPAGRFPAGCAGVAALLVAGRKAPRRSCARPATPGRPAKHRASGGREQRCDTRRRAGGKVRGVSELLARRHAECILVTA